MPANAPHGLQFWWDEVDRAVRINDEHAAAWQTNLDYYAGTPLTSAPTTDYVNVNVDYAQTEVIVSQLFFDTPELQVVPGAGFEPTAPGVVAFKNLLNAILGADHIDALTTTLKAIKSCVAVSGVGPTVIGYQPTIQQIPPGGVSQPGAVLGLSQPTPVPVYEQWFWDTLSNKKFLRPADFHDTAFDTAPWLAMKARLPLRAARRICPLPPDFEGTRTRDEAVLNPDAQADDSSLASVDLVLIWYQAALFDDDVIHPLIYRRHILIDGLETFADQVGPDGTPDPMWQSPYQTLLPNGRLSGDSLIGNPIHPIVLQDLPDSSFPPADAQMTRPLVQELCLFRSQMVRERDINTPKFGYNAEVIPPDAVDKITQAMTGSLVPLPAAAFAGGLQNNFQLLTQGSSPRQTYLANDYITRDIEKTHGIDGAGQGVTEDADETATKTAEVARSRNVRLDAKRKRVLRWYLKGVDKVAALVLRFCTDPQRVAEWIGPAQAQAYLTWRQTMVAQGDVRPKFTAKADSQIKLDAAAERKTWLQFYNFAAKDPLMNRGALLTKIVQLYGEDPAAYVAQAPPEQTPEPSLGYSFKGEDLNPLSPQFPIVLQILAQCGVAIDAQTIQEAKDGAQNQVLMEQLAAVNATAKAAAKKPAGHGGLADKQGPLSKQDSEQTGNRPGAGPQVQ